MDSLALNKANELTKENIEIVDKAIRDRELNEPPKRSVLEEIGNSITHGVGALMAIPMLVFMILYSDTGFELWASLVYGISMFIMMMMSCLYHAFPQGSKVKRLWRRFDYSSIYLLIGGTYAPIFLMYVGGTLGVTLFSIQWAIIAFGITMIAIFGPGRVKVLNFVLYFTIGWIGILFIPSMAKNNLPLLLWILGGGITYTLGMIPFGMKKVKATHFIWHFFVLAGCIIQYVGIFLTLFL